MRIKILRKSFGAGSFAASILVFLAGGLRGAPPTGQVVDARTGAPLGGVGVRGTYSLLDDGDPPLPEPGSRHSVRTDPGGLFTIPPFRVEDPRVKLHLEADHPDFLPAAMVIEEEPTTDGARPFVILKLRRASTRKVLLLDPGGRPLPELPVEVEELPEDAFLGEDLFEREGDGERAARPDRPPIRTTRPDGTLRLAERVVSLSLRHPFLHFWDLEPPQVLRDEPPPPLLPLPRATLVLDLRPDRLPSSLRTREIIIHTRASDPRVYAVRDLAGNPAADAIVEIQLEGLPAVRLHTDGRGAFSFAPLPYGTQDIPLTTPDPRRGALTVLSPLLWKRTTPVSFPSAAGLYTVGARTGGRLTFRLGESLPGESLPGKTLEKTSFRPVPAERVRTSEELTVVRRTVDGEVVLEGPLPPGGSFLTVAITGYLPLEVRVPPHLPGRAQLDLGNLLLERRGSFLLRLDGGRPEEWERASFLIAERDGPAHLQEYRPGSKGQAAVGGLIEGRAYLYALEGPGIERVEGELLATPGLFRDGLTVPVAPVRPLEKTLTARVVGLRPEEASSYRVVERYELFGAAEPAAFIAYPLAPDGIVGTRRVLPDAARAEVFVVGPRSRAGHAAREFAPGVNELDLGRIILRESHHATFTYLVEGLGRVRPPRDLTLFAEERNDHQVARMSVEDREVALQNLRPGRYRLRWGGHGEEEEMFSFLVLPPEIEIRAEVPRKPGLREEVEFRVVDGEGAPVSGARIVSGDTGAPLEPPQAGPSPRAAGPGPGPPTAAGTYRLEIGIREENRFRVLAEGFIPLRVVLPVGSMFPDPIVLRRGARVKGTARESDGRRYDGELSVGFDPAGTAPGAGVSPRGKESEPGRPEAILVHGEHLVISVEEGLFQSALFPPGRSRVTFRIPGSEAKLEAVYDLEEKRINDLGTVLLRETRSLTGSVLLPYLEPAADALMTLVKPAAAHRFPQRPQDASHIVYSARCDALGRFRIDGLPLDLKEELALVAHLDGYTDAVESPVDLAAAEHELVLGQPTVLNLDVGYDQEGGREDYQFRLEHRSLDGGLAGGGTETFTDLGPYAPDRRGGVIYQGITPGRYRVLWELREAHPGIPPRFAEARVEPGAPATLSLRVRERTISGQAYLNGEPLSSGWVLLLADPSRPAEAMVGRVRQGAFKVPVPLRAERAHASLIPQREPLIAPDFSRGEALPREVPDSRRAARNGFITIEHRAHDLTVILPGGFEAPSNGAEVEFPHYTGHPGGYRRELRREPLRENPFRLQLVPAGSFSLRITGRSGSYLVQNLELNQDTTLRLGG